MTDLKNSRCGNLPTKLVDMLVCMCVCMYVFMYVCVCVCMYMCVSLKTSAFHLFILYSIHYFF